MGLHRRLTSRIIGAVLLGIVCRAVAAAQGAPATPAAPNAPVPAKVFTWADPQEEPLLDGGFSTSAAGNSLLRLMFNSLVKLNAELGLEPDLAESWSVAADGVTWTFRLRRGVKFSNGNPLNAEAVRWSLMRVIDPAVSAPNRSALAQLKTVNVVDDHTVRIITTVPAPDLLTALADRVGIVHDPRVAQTYAPKELGRHPLGTGPYKLVEWMPGQRLVFDRNPHWWGPPTAMDRIVYRIVPEAATRQAMLVRGEADLISSPPLEALPALKKDSAIKVIVADGLLSLTWEMLTDKPPLNDVRVRRAIVHAIDRKAIIDGLLLGLAKEYCTTVGPAVGREFVFEQPCYEYDPQKAKRLLAEAGYPNGVKIEMWAPGSRYPKGRETAEAVQAMLKSVGIDGSLRLFEWATYSKMWSDPGRTMWMLGRVSGFTDFIFTRQFARSMWDSGGNNNTRFQDPRVEELLVRARGEFDRAKRAGYYQDIQKITWEQVPLFPMYVQKIVLGARANVQEVVVLPNEEILLYTAKKR